MEPKNCARLRRLQKNPGELQKPHKGWSRSTELPNLSLSLELTKRALTSLSARVMALTVRYVCALLHNDPPEPRRLLSQNQHKTRLLGAYVEGRTWYEGLPVFC